MTAAAVVSALVALTVVLPALASRSIIPASGSNTCNAAPWRIYRPSTEVRRPGLSSFLALFAPHFVPLQRPSLPAQPCVHCAMRSTV